MIKLAPSKHASRSSLLVSALAHACVFGGLWFTATEFTPDAIQPPQTIDTTILPPPKPIPETPAPVIAPVAKQSNASEGKAAAKGMASQAKNSQGKNQNNSGKALSDGVAEQDKTGTGSGLGDAGENRGNQSPPAQAELPSGVPSPVKINGGFTVKYEAKGEYKGFEAGGGGTLIFNKSGETYTASLEAKAAGFGIEATSKGQIRSDTIAVERFTDKKTKLIGKARVNTLGVDYATKEMHFGSRGVQELKHNVVYDYLSAIVYVQSFFQSGKTNASFTLPVARSSQISDMRIQSGAAAEVVTDDGTFTGIPVTFNIENGSIATIRAWFVPSKQYRPLRIEITFKDDKGYVNLVSRNSPD
ncbi:hypothetical protein GCM10009007_13980 [Formosimonas limnophila]|uniref:DUF3108 domain-containing protein n=1 Tax=Formosimonas limnophila TaxID=1384487 RepID=A0A8J3G0Q7_9BURK|nr:DUF3108 domain-containing protein [Formosimonas limnophila]GHA74025.1 hypothetical protein GCM10009007_13980 [Formosimonas limnophila]